MRCFKITTMALFLFAGLLLPEASAQQEKPDGLIDHHLHVLSPKLIADWKSVGARFSRGDESYSKPTAFCDENRITKGFLVSMAHIYTTADFPGESAQQHAAVSRENDFVGSCVRSNPDRFIGFFSVNPLRDWAFEEMERCHGQTGLTGLKLHFPACDVNFLDESHMKKLTRVFQWAAKKEVPLLVHVSGFEREFNRAEARLFWQKLVKPNPSIHLYLAHLGTSGGYNERARVLFDEFRNLSKDGKFDNKNIYFDMSGAILAESIDGVEATSEALCKELAKQIEDIGVGHFVFASDYPVFSPQDFVTALKEKVPLKPETMAKLMANESPLFRSAGR